MRTPAPPVFWGVLLLLSSPAALADSAIIGTVTNAATRKPVADGVVTATSPQLEGERAVFTDPQGQYRLPELPPGTYTLRFEREGFRTYARQDIQLRQDRTARVNVELLPEGFVDELPIASAPTIDTGQGCNGGIIGDYVPRVAVRHPVWKEDRPRPFEPMTGLASVEAQRRAFF